jgi:hypothetical protein
MINAIIFSKDRACQLDCLLRSIERNVEKTVSIKWSVVYLATTREHQRGYEKLFQRAFRGCIFYDEKKEGFKQTTLNLLKEEFPYHVFFVDDDCFKSSWNPNDGSLDLLKQRKDLLTVSLRMDPSYDFCYTQKQKTPPPIIGKDGIWEWKDLQGDWGYPMSLDGHIFHSHDVLPLIRSINFKNPNSLEGRLATQVLGKPLMFCYPNAKIINLPINKVQTVNKNHAGLYHPTSIEELNRHFLSGEQLSLEAIMKAKGFNAPHFELPLLFEAS